MQEYDSNNLRAMRKRLYKLNGTIPGVQAIEAENCDGNISKSWVRNAMEIHLRARLRQKIKREAAGRKRLQRTLVALRILKGTNLNH